MPGYTRINILTALFFTALPMAGPVRADDADLTARLAAIEKAIDTRRDELHIPGASLVIVKDDKVVYIKGLGLRNVEDKLPVTPDTLFAIGSSTKAFTGMTVMMSVDEGKLSLADPPQKYLPYFKLRDEEANSKITISDLLCHRSGLARTDMAWGTGRLTPVDVIKVAGNAKPGAKFGQTFQYQNVMFLAAGEAVASAQHMPWRTFLKKRIFDPLGMTSTNSSISEMMRADDLALGYAYNAGTKEFVHLPMRNLECIAPAGAINSNAVDMAKWVRLMLNEGAVNGKRLVTERSFKELISPHMTMGGTSSYGYGWMLHDWNGHKVVEHGGNIDGFNAQVALMPDQKLGFALLTNVSASPLGAYAMDTVWSNFLGAPTKKEVKGEAPAAPVGPAIAPENEVGTYRFAAANVAVTISLSGDKLQFNAPQQPPYPLEQVSGRRYKLGSPAPDGFFATFRPKKDDPTKSELYVEQPQGNVVFTKEEVKDSPISITADELFQKTIAAAGGEANLRKHHSLETRFTLKIETQGVDGVGRICKLGPNLRTEEVVLKGAGKEIGRIRDYFDGKAGGTDVSFSGSAVKTGAALVDAAAEADFNRLLDWNKLYRTVKIKGTAKVGEEEAYQVELKPENGSPVTDFISTKSFLVVKRILPGGVTETLKDYRAVDGVMMPFTRLVTGPIGDEEIKVTSARFDIPLARGLFQSHAQVTGTRTPEWMSSAWE